MIDRHSTRLEKDRTRCVTNVVCEGCGKILAWVSDRMQRAEPTRAKQLLLAAHRCPTDGKIEAHDG